MTEKPHRDTIFVEEAIILSHEMHPGDQFVLRVSSPKCAENAKPGQFSHIQCDPLQPLRRPISIMRASPEEGWVEYLYKRVGVGTTLLSERKAGESLSVLGPVGNSFEVTCKKPLLIGGGVGMPPMVFLADHLRRIADVEPFVILGSEVPFPFTPKPSQHIIKGIPDGVIGAMPLLEDWGVASRLASMQGFTGCHQGYVTDLARLWLDSLDEKSRSDVAIYSCGPHPMLEAVVTVAREYNLPVWTSLEEFMACAVGGCAGCVVEVATDNGPSMQRVCVDGPVFNGHMIFT